MCQIEFKFNKKKYLWLQGFNEHTRWRKLMLLFFFHILNTCSYQILNLYISFHFS